MTIKIIYVTTSFPYSYGKESFFFPELIELARQGHEVLVVPRSLIGFVDVEYQEFFAKNVAAKGLFSYEVLKEAFFEFIRNPSRVFKMFLLMLQSWGPETLLKNLVVLPKGLWLARLSLKWGATHIHAQWAGTTASMAMIASEISNIPWSFTAHRGDILQKNLLNFKASSTCFVRFISMSGIRLAEKLNVQQLLQKARLIHMAVSVPLDGSDQVSAGTSPTVLCPADFLPVKGHKYLLEAVAILKERGIGCSLQLAGEGRLHKQLQQQVVDLSILDKVSFLGHIPHTRLMKLYYDKKVAIVVLPSVDLGTGEHEGIPVSLIEAMSYGIPVIATKTGGIPELLTEGAGILIPPKNPVAIADAIETLIKDRKKQSELGKAGKQRIIEQFAIEKTVNELVSSISTVTRHNGEEIRKRGRAVNPEPC